MKAAVFTEKHKPLSIKEVPRPRCNANEVVLKVSACGLCRTDLHYIEGVPTFKKPPIILGHEISGVVEEVGTDVQNFKKGDRVLVPPVFSCGTCAYCRSGRGTLCMQQVMVGNHRDGGFSEYISVPADNIFLLPEEVPLQEGCIISDAISTPYHAVVNRAEVRSGDTVAVFGCGGVGLPTVQMAALAGANVIAVDLIDEKLALARKLGAAETVNARTADNVPKEIRKLTHGGADIAIEVIGSPETIQAAYESVKWGGRVVVVGYTHKDVSLNAGRLMFREIELRGSLGCGLQEYPKIIEMVRRGLINVKELVTHKFPLEDINEGFALLRSGEPGLVRAIAVP
jgi:6-hydroxycyclohex-1-ene-1-carbonyl-CoA dehydrogenase